MVVSDSRAQQKSVPSSVDLIPFVDAACRTLPQTEKAKARALKLLLVGTGLVFFATCGASAFYGRRSTGRSPPRKAKRSQVLPPLLMSLKAPVEAIYAPEQTRGGALRDRRPPPRDANARHSARRVEAAGAGIRLRGGSALQQGRCRGPRRARQGARDPDERLALEWASLRSDAHLSVCGADGVCRSPSRMAGRRVDSAPARSATARQFRGGGEGRRVFRQRAAANKRGNDCRRARGERDRAVRRGGKDHSRVVARRRFRPFHGNAHPARIWRSAHKADHKYRADRLLYAESFESALRAAALAGPDIPPWRGPASPPRADS